MFDVIHQWICLNELYKLINSIFQISFQNYGQKTKKKKIFKRIERREY